jgi:hypothetical protein
MLFRLSASNSCKNPGLATRGSPVRGFTRFTENKGLTAMRDLTRAELEEYFQFAHNDQAACNFHEEQTQLVGQVVANSGLIDATVAGILAKVDERWDPQERLLALWVMAFQMGRECESRLLSYQKAKSWRRVRRSS